MKRAELKSRIKRNRKKLREERGKNWLRIRPTSEDIAGDGRDGNFVLGKHWWEFWK